MSTSQNFYAIGNLARDPEVRYGPSGNAVTNIVVATSEEWKDKQTGEKKSETEYHRCVLFNRQAEVAGEYLKKGSLVHITGRLKTRKWEDNDGITRYSTEIVVSSFNMLGSKSQSDSAPSEQRQATQRPQDRRAPARKPQAQLEPAMAGDYDDEDDNIPF